MALKKQEKNCNFLCCPDSQGCDFVKKLSATLVIIFLVYLIFYVGTLVRNNIKEYDYIGSADKMERMITISGYGEVKGSNDIAMTTLGYSNTDKDVAVAQAGNKEVMDGIMADLKEMGIDSSDLQSDYSIYPEYEYGEDGREFIGYRVNSNISVKIRDLSKIENVLSLAGKYGANQVSGLQFTIDDPENLKDEARNKAIADAQVKALELSKRLGVILGSVVSYNEYSSQSPDVYAKYYSNEAFYGLGGGAVADVESGSQDVGMNVNITYEVLR